MAGVAIWQWFCVIIWPNQYETKYLCSKYWDENTISFLFRNYKIFFTFHQEFKESSGDDLSKEKDVFLITIQYPKVSIAVYDISTEL